MDELQNLLQDTLSKFEALKVKNEITISENIEKLREECTPEQVEKLETAFANAKNGKGNPEDLINQFKTF
jgi:hypothetical protein